MAARFSSSGKPEVLDYLIEYATSGTPADTLNIVHNLRYTAGWSGSFCSDAFQGEMSGTAQYLSDHNAVLPKFTLPPINASANDVTSLFNSAFDQRPRSEHYIGEQTRLKDGGNYRAFGPWFIDWSVALRKVSRAS